MNKSLKISVKKTFGSGSESRTLEFCTEIRTGELLAVSGSSGCGKTTLLRLLAGLCKADEGYIRYGDEIWFDSAKGIDLAPQKRRTGVVFQDYALFPNMSLGENIRFALRDPGDACHMEKVVRLLGIEGLLKRKPGQVSGGQRQRAAFARALALRPSLMLLDEPFSALDWELRWRLQDELKNWHREFGCTTLVVSHDLLELFRVADRVIRLDGDPPCLADIDKAALLYAQLRDYLAPFPE